MKLLPWPCWVVRGGLLSIRKESVLEWLVVTFQGLRYSNPLLRFSLDAWESFEVRKETLVLGYGHRDLVVQSLGKDGG